VDKYSQIDKYEELTHLYHNRSLPDRLCKSIVQFDLDKFHQHRPLVLLNLKGNRTQLDIYMRLVLGFFNPLDSNNLMNKCLKC